MFGRRRRDDAAWREFFAELDRWPAGTASFWWRDDDAVEPRERLDRLLGLGGQPLAIAVIPGPMRVSLVDRLARERVQVLQHGYNHANHEPPGRDLAELGPARPLDAALDELARGRRRLAALFGAQFLPVLVPPWHCISNALLQRLGELGFAAVSSVGVRARGVPGPLRLNGHADLMDWTPRGLRREPRFLGAAATLGLMTAHLAARRRGEADRTEATGLITHHLAMDKEAFAFTAEFLARSAAHPAVVWRSIGDLLDEQRARAGPTRSPSLRVIA